MTREFDPRGPLPRGVTLMEASAGTGKTWTITSLVLRLVVEHGLAVDRILVVTFTEAATAELRDRVRKRLRLAWRAYGGEEVEGDDLVPWLVEQSRGGGTEARDRERVQAALTGFDEAAISTIHGFCRRVLLENAFESGVPFDTDILPDQGALLEEVVADYWTRELAELEPERVRALKGDEHHPLSLADLRHLAGQVVADRDVEVLPHAPGGPDLAFGFAAEPESHAALDLKLRLVPWVREELASRKRDLAAVSYDDLLHLLADALDRESGEALAAAIRGRYRAALIDEFQDTDPVQYRIFGQVFGASGWLFLIGDPKQAIYGFRGADIHAYLRAARDAGERTFTLGTNWRSDGRLVTALEHLFTRPDSPFVDPRIHFVRVRADHADDRLAFPDGPRPPLCLRLVTREDVGWVTRPKSGSPRLAKRWAWAQLPRYVAAEIVELLTSGATIEGRPLQPGDIAVLVRKNKQAESVQEALRKVAVPSVRYGASSVFRTPAAADLRRVLAAVADPSVAARVRAAMSTVTMGTGGGRLAALEEDERAWDDAVEAFRDLHRRWSRYGFIQMFRAWLALPDLQSHLLSLADGERRMTDLLHLSELLHKASRDLDLGMPGLLRWMDRAMEDGGDAEASQVRLESDSRCVQVVTVHKSKGLQYPVVLCPFLWDGYLLHRAEEKHVRFHDPDDDDRLKLDIGSADRSAHRRLASRELHAENLRLLYVALTRAKHRCVVYYGPFTQVDTSPLGHLLHPAPGETGVEGLRRAVARIRAASVQHLLDEARLVAHGSGGTIEAAPLPDPEAEPWRPEDEDRPALSARQPHRRLDANWRTSSFSALTQGAHGGPVEEGLDHDAHTSSPQAEAPRPRPEEARVALADFERGARAGTFLHKVLEEVDFQAPEALLEVTRAQLGAHGLDPDQAAVVAAALRRAMHTPLWPDGPRLADVSTSARLDELGFVFPVLEEGSTQLGLFRAGPSRLLPDHLARVFRRHASSAVPGSYADSLAALDFEPLHGFLTGFVDLVFEHEDRFYVVDYKSNHLGDTPSDYGFAAMQRSMAEHHYFLQYHLYLVALHRYLGWRVHRYEPERHLGGAAYLYLRGMSPESGPTLGVFRDRPSPDMITALSDALAGR